MPSDALGRAPVSDDLRRVIRDAFAAVPEGKRGAMLIIVDSETKEARMHLAAKLGSHWQVAGGASFPWNDPRRPSGWVGVEATW